MPVGTVYELALHRPLCSLNVIADCTVFPNAAHMNKSRCDEDSLQSPQLPVTLLMCTCKRFASWVKSRHKSKLMNLCHSASFYTAALHSLL